ncbi:hypothetical protein [Halobacillus amylolyticus]|uniref:Uncharacterized protein n=1 Tax=Halobacillus amylolyticus TaxID=2932259 RepID=A0ABY4HDV6_9BACI|nr:hypothetical protein [Halobacillus amylolyticus]UOR12842.1 hypothetical protein MUO15_04845 [Halobacillus amylolyticus]
MFEKYNEIYLKKDTYLKSQGRIYSLTSTNKMIGTIEETLESTKNIVNQLLNLITLFSVTSLELNVMDNKAKVLGTIKKEKGFYKDFLLFSSNGEHMATIKPTIKIKSPLMNVIDVNENNLIKAVGVYGATDFSVIDCRTNKQISTIKRRSLVSTTIKENLLNDDGYYIDNTNQDSLTSFALIAMSLIVDIYFFHK